MIEHDVAQPGTVCVVGLGKIGLPLAVQFARSGFRVIGADISDTVVDLVNSGIEPFPGETDLALRLAAVVESGQLRATTDTAGAVAASRVIVVVVPLIVDHRGIADFGALDAATEAIGSRLSPGSIVLYETTVPVGTTRTRFAPALASASALVAGKDFHVAFSPERVYSGRIFADLRRYPKLVGGLDRRSSELAVEFYEQALEFDARPDLVRSNGVWDLGTAEAAELAKLAETTYRDINIAFANELAAFSEDAGIDVFQVIEASNSQPFSHIHQPGVAVGGHCIPVYPRLFLMNAPDARVPAAAREANLAVPARVVERLSSACGGLRGEHVVVFGAAYRGGVKETAFSGVFPLVAALRERGAQVSVHDPLYSDDELRHFGFEPYALGDGADAAVIQADHTEYRTMTPTDVPGIRVLLDGRRCTTPAVWSSAGVIHLQLGTAMAASEISDEAPVER